jgi:hypothetical protein
MDTRYWIQGDRIYGPEDSGSYWIVWDRGEGSGQIHGPRNTGLYWIDMDSGRIYGPVDTGAFWLQHSHIYGPSTPPPWMLCGGLAPPSPRCPPVPSDRPH